MKRKKIIENIKCGKMAIKKDSKEALKACLSYLFPHDKDFQNKEIINNKSNKFYKSRWYDTAVWRGYADTDKPHIGALELLIKIKGAHAIAEMYKAQARRIDELHEKNEKRIEELEKEIKRINNNPANLKEEDKSIDAFIAFHGEKFSSMKVDLLKGLNKLGFVIQVQETSNTLGFGDNAKLILTHSEIGGVLKIEL